MLGKAKQIFVSYGAIDHPKTKFVVRAIKHEIDYLSRRGYRIQLRVIAGEYWIEKGGEISAAIRKEIDSADGAIIILTPVDVGTTLSDIVKLEDLKKRARQNVIHEYGFLQATLPHSHIKVFSDKSVEIPSNLINFHRVSLSLDFIDSGIGPKLPRDGLLAFKAIRKHVRGLVVGPMKTRRIKSEPLSDTNWPIDLIDFVQAKASLRETDLVSEWTALLNALDKPTEKLLSCYERIVFDTYLAPRDVWQSAILKENDVTRSDPTVASLYSAVAMIRQYQIAMAENKMTYELALEICSNLNRDYNQIKNIGNLAPITKVAILDYLGLSHMRIADFLDGRRTKWWQFKARSDNQKLAIEHYKSAREYLSQSADLARPSEDVLGHPVWQAFALFNRARSERKIGLLTNSLDVDWLSTINNAIAKRKILCGDQIEVPESIKMGFLAEYIHACLYKWEEFQSPESYSTIKSARQAYDRLKASELASFPLRKSVEERYEKALSVAYRRFGS